MYTLDVRVIVYVNSCVNAGVDEGASPQRRYGTSPVGNARAKGWQAPKGLRCGRTDDELREFGNLSSPKSAKIARLQERMPIFLSAYVDGGSRILLMGAC